MNNFLSYPQTPLRCPTSISRDKLFDYELKRILDFCREDIEDFIKQANVKGVVWAKILLDIKDYYRSKVVKIPNKKDHDKYAIKRGIPRRTASWVNKYMDYPARRHPGCRHREERHDQATCKRIGKWRGPNAKKACEYHLELDKKFDKCQINNKKND